MENLSQQTWQQTPESLTLSSDYVDVWLCHLQDLSTDMNKFYALLSDDECKRADRFKIEDKKRQFVIVRGVLRQRLGSFTNTDPKDFTFDYLEHGKPVLSDKQKYADIRFNISHSHDLALVAISKSQQIGIDIERINRQSDTHKLVTRFFSKAEQSEFNALPESIKAQAFCACWARKEAFIKAEGSGVAYGLANFSVSVDPDIQKPEINLAEASTEKWSAINLPIHEEYMACLVSNTDRINVRLWQ